MATWITCKDLKIRPSEYLYGEELSLQDKADIDFIVVSIGKDYEAEQAKNQENES